MMPQVHFVKKARKDNPAVSKGDSYYWWKTRVTVGKSFHGQKHYSAEYPRQSQLTQSEFLSQVYQIEEQVSDLSIDGDLPAEALDQLENLKEELASQLDDLADEQESKLESMPESLQDGPTGELLRGRADEAREMAEQYRAIDTDLDEDATDDEAQNYARAVVDEFQSIGYGGE